MVLRPVLSRYVVVGAETPKRQNVGGAGAHNRPQDLHHPTAPTTNARKIAPLPTLRRDLNHARFKRRTSKQPDTYKLGPSPIVLKKRDRSDEDKENVQVDKKSSITRPTKRPKLASKESKPITLSYRVQNVIPPATPPASEHSPKIIKGFTHPHERELAQVVVSKVHAVATVVHPLDDYELQTTSTPSAAPEFPVATRPAPPPPPSSDAKLIKQRQAEAFKSYLTPSSELKLYRTMQVRTAIRTGKAHVAYVPMVRSTLSGPRTAKDKWNKLKVRIINRPPRGATTSSSVHITKRPKPTQHSLVRYATMMNFAVRDAQRAREELLQAAANGQLAQRPIDGLDDEQEDQEDLVEEGAECNVDNIIGDSFDWTHPDLL